jgi:hypothetical protein
MLGDPNRSRAMSFSSVDRSNDLERRVANLEIKLITVASHAELAWESERERRKASYEFWWFASRFIAIVTCALAWGLLLFGKPSH